MRFLRLPLAFLAALVLLTATAIAEAPAPMLHVNGGEVGLIYKEMNEESDALRTLAAGEAFQLVQRTGDWAQIRVTAEDGSLVDGFALSTRFREQTPADGFAFARVSPKEGAMHAELRSQARSKSDPLGKYFYGVIARVLEQKEDGWVKLGIGILEGYMRSDELVLLQASDNFQPALPEVSVQYEDGTGLTMRAAQSFQSEKMGAYSNGIMVKVLGFTDDFAHVYGPDGKVGFMMAWGVSPQAANLVTGGADPMSTPPPDATLTTISNPDGQGAHLRTRASTDSESLGLYKNGAQVYVISYGEFWSQVWADGKTGHMMTKLLGDTASPPPVAD